VKNVQTVSRAGSSKDESSNTCQRILLSETGSKSFGGASHMTGYLSPLISV